jgi:hypothetical protein
MGIVEINRADPVYPGDRPAANRFIDVLSGTATLAAPAYPNDG